MSSKQWMAVAQSYQGLKEISGSKHNKTIVEFFERAGHPEVKDDETAWCSAFVNAVFEDVGIKGTGSLLARSWLTWGKALKTPSYGCVVVMKRGNSSWQGHVAFFVKEDSRYVYVLGGNQGNGVNVSRYSKSSVLGYRWPPTLARSRTAIGAGVGTAAEVARQSVDVIAKTQDTIAGIPIDSVKYILLAITVVSFGLIMYARWDDMKRKGR